jgi:hypothetical protein
VEQTRQILQVKANTFGPVKTENAQLELSDATLVLASKFMGDMAKDYAEGRLLRGDLKDERDKRLRALGLTSQRARAPQVGEPPAPAPHTVAKKRPAAAVPMPAKTMPAKMQDETDGHDDHDKKARSSMSSMLRQGPPIDAIGLWLQSQ